jgi:hypothetical protein
MLQTLFLWSIGAPLVVLAAVTAVAVILAMKSGGRREQAIGDHEALAASRFTIPVSVIVPLSIADRSDPTTARTIGALLDLNYPEFELIVVADAAPELPVDFIKEAWELTPHEFFYRQSLATGAIYRIYRSARDTRLLFAEKAPDDRADSANCGVNLARYRYATVVDPHAVFDANSLLRAMSAPLADPAAVVAASSHLESGSTAGNVEGVFESLASVRALLESRLIWRRLRNGVGPDARLVVWRRDALLQMGGFSGDAADPELDLMARLQSSGGSPDGSAAPAVVRTAEIFGRSGSRSWRSTGISHRFEAILQALRCGLSMPTFAYLLASRVLVPVILAWVVVATAISAAAGWLPWRDVALVLMALSFGQALLTTAAVLVRGSAPDGPDEAALKRLLTLAPCELLLHGPVSALRRVTGALAFAKLGDQVR